jgi:secreted trypsin-like serine protease
MQILISIQIWGQIVVAKIIKTKKQVAHSKGLKRTASALCLLGAITLGATQAQAEAGNKLTTKAQIPSSSDIATTKKYDDMSIFMPRIVGGEAANENYPWMVSLQRVLINGNSSHICGGSFIDSRWVLTAAHCVLGAAPNQLRLFSGTNELDDPNGQFHDIVAVHVHEDYDPATLLNDIALLELSQPADIPLLVETADEDYMIDVVEDDLVRVIGWGALAQNNNNLPNELQEVDVPVRTQPQCLDAYPGADSIIAGTTVCAGIPEGGIDSCQGDSGGPLFQADAAGVGYTQVGIVSWGIGCAQPNAYGVYTRVASFQDWIDGFISGAFFEGVPFMGYIGLNAQATSTYFVQNNSDAAITVQAVTVDGQDAANFEVDATDCTGADIAPGQDCTVLISVSSAVPGELTATITAQLDNITLSADVAAVALPELAEGPAALDSNDVLVYSGEDLPWGTAADAAAVGAESLKSGAIGDNQLSVTAAVVQGPGGVSFSYRVSSEENFDKLIVLHNGEAIVDASGEVAYTDVTRTLVPGDNHLVFAYVKDATQAAGDDAAWIDNMVVVLDELPPPPPPPPPNNEVDPIDDPAVEPPVDPVTGEPIAAAVSWTFGLALFSLLVARATRRARREA